MSTRPWMAFYPADFQLDTLELAADEVGIYVVLICLAWRSGTGSVTGDMAELRRTLQCCIAKFHGLTFNRIVPNILARYFERRDDGRFYQKRVEKELRKAEELSEKQSRNAKERWSQRKDNNDLADATAMPLQLQLQSQLQSKKKERGATRPSPKGSRLIDGWKPSDQGREFAESLLGEQGALLEFDKFCDYWRGLSGGRAVKSDWEATWRNWCRRASEYRNNGKPNGKSKSLTAAADRALARLEAVERAPEICAGEGATIIQLLPKNGG